MTKVVISGLGVVSAVGGGTLEDYWNGLLYRQTVPEEFPYGNDRRYYWVRDWVPLASVMEQERVGRATALALGATEMALEDAGLLAIRTDGVIGLALGTALGDDDLLSDERAGGSSVSPFRTWILGIATILADRFQATGPNFSLSTACSSSGFSVSTARDAILDGWTDVMIAVGTEGFTRVGTSCLNRMRALDQICRPFDVERVGTVLGEGAAVLILESKDHARRRGCQHWYAEFKGYGWSCDGYHPTAPDPSGKQAELAILRALEDANLTPDDIDCIVPHGTGTELNDLAESACLEKVFGSAVERLHICADKSKLGHTSGAAGALSCVTAALILDRGLVPPTANVKTLDPRCRIKLHVNRPIQADVRNVLVNSYGFGGSNVSVILGKAN